MTSLWKKIAFAALVALGIGIAAAAVAAIPGDDATPQPSSQVRQAEPETPARLADLLQVFRRPQDSADRLPGDPEKAIKAFGEDQPGEDPADARRLPVAGRAAAHAWPMRNGACYAWAGVAGCGPTTLLKDEGAIVGYGRQGADDNWTFLALVRDGVPDLEIVRADRTTSTHPVRNNVVGASLAEAPVAVRLTLPDGREHTLRLPGG